MAGRGQSQQVWGTVWGQLGGNKVTHQNTELARGQEARRVGRLQVSFGLTLKGVKEVEERAGHWQEEGLTGAGCGFLGGAEGGWLGRTLTRAVAQSGSRGQGGKPKVGRPGGARS